MGGTLIDEGHRTRLIGLSAFLFGIALTLAAVFFGVPAVTGFAVLSPTVSQDNLTENVEPSFSSPANESNSSVQIAIFQNINATTLGAKCEQNPYMVQRFKWPYTCTLFYGANVSVREVGPSGSMWPALSGGGYVLVADVTDTGRAGCE